MSAYTEALKASIRSQTELQPKLIASSTISNLRTDDIFTNLLIQHGRKALFKGNTSTRRDLLDHYGKVSDTDTPVKNCEELFACSPDSEHNPKTILLFGKAGIGKTLFCQKLIRDWANDKLFRSQANLQTPDIKFAYLLTFRQLNLLGKDDPFSLRELLNRSLVLDDKTNIDDSLFEYLVEHPNNLLVILDGFDEYSRQKYIADNLDKQYPNDAREKMPVAALCAKLIKGDILRESVVMITSRPEKSDKIGGIDFDRYVEITGFSQQQVKESIEKYFKENETMKNAVLEHVMNNENLVSFAHVPVLCFLMCFYLEYILQKSKVSKSTDLPVSLTEIYSEVVNTFELKHNAESEYKAKEIPEDYQASDVIESTLDKLSELAAQLLLQKKAIFDEKGMKKSFKAEEIKRLIESGLLHCGPPFRNTAFQTTKQLSFTHITIQEYLAARWFVMKNEIPEDMSDMVMQFMAGVLSQKGDEELMKKLLKSVSSSSKRKFNLLGAKCLSEYKDKKFAKNIIRTHPRQYYDQGGKMLLNNISNLDCIAISFLLDVISELNEEEAVRAQQPEERSVESSTVNSLSIQHCSTLTPSGIKRICESLKKKHCAVTKLFFSHSRLSDERIAERDSISLILLSSKLMELHLASVSITHTGVASLSKALQHPSCKVKTLRLSNNQLTDTDVSRVCEATCNCKVTTLELSYHQITDTGVAKLCEALQHSGCKVTTLYLSYNKITDTNTGVAKLREALQCPSCKVTTLDLRGNQISDTGVAKLREALQHSSCKVTTLSLSNNQITDTGVAKLCQALQHQSCKVTTLDLSKNQITDTGVARLWGALQHSSCKVTTLDLTRNDDISEESKEFLRNMVREQKTYFKLDV